jgi:hypothetical protein
MDAGKRNFRVSMLITVQGYALVEAESKEEARRIAEAADVDLVKILVSGGRATKEIGAVIDLDEITARVEARQ